MSHQNPGGGLPAAIPESSRTSIVDRVYLLLDSARQAGLRLDVQRSDIVLRLLTPLVCARWRARRGSHPAPRSPLGPADLGVLEELLGASFDALLADAAERVGRVVGTLADLLADRGASATARAFSERVCVRLKQYYLEERSPSDAECDALAAELADLATLPPPLDARAFKALHTAAWDTCWQAEGAANLLAHPPSEVRLGRDRPPALVGVRGPERHNWFQGTDRSVHDRYRLHFWGAPASPTACSSPLCAPLPRCVRIDPGFSEVVRACAPYGLTGMEHQQAVRSIAEGLSVEPTGSHGWTTWERWATPCRPLRTDGAVDPDLVDAVASAFAAWAGSDVGGPLVRQHGIGVLTGAAASITVRKVWMGLHRRERDGAPPLRRCGVPRLLRAALYRHLPVALRDWLRGELVEAPDPSEGYGEGGPPTPDAVNPYDATLALLTAHPELVRLMIQGDTGWHPRYRDLVSGAPGGPTAHLDITAAFDLVRHLLEGMDS